MCAEARTVGVMSTEGADVAQSWKDLPKSDDAIEALAAIIEQARHDAPYLAQVARTALDAIGVVEFAAVLVSVYRIALEEGHPFIPDLTDGLLRWLERHAPTLEYDEPPIPLR
ncbi:MAG: hypothetical protein JWM86_1624 [Thermoleophilia bacterium]|nr:hypothetical protein [Thermoleophilia bacterium]